MSLRYYNSPEPTFEVEKSVYKKKFLWKSLWIVCINLSKSYKKDTKIGEKPVFFSKKKPENYLREIISLIGK